MKYGIWLLIGSLVTLLVAVVKPEVAHLALQALLVIALSIVVIETVAMLLQRLPKSPYASGWRLTPKTRPDLPRDISTASEELKKRGRYLPISVASKLAQLYDEKLVWRHGLSAVRDRDLPQLQHLLSPAAYHLVTARHQAWSGGRHPFERIARTSLEPLLTELEHL